MISLKGPGFKIVAAIVGLAALVFGNYSTFFMSSGYKTTTATIVSIEEDPNYIPDPNSENDKQYIATAKYTVDGKEYLLERQLKPEARGDIIQKLREAGIKYNVNARL